MDKKNSQEQQKSKLWRIIGVSLFFFTIAVLVVGLIYLIWSAKLIILERKLFPNDFSVGAVILNFLALLVEVIGIFYTVMLFKHVGTTSYHSPVDINQKKSALEEYPRVSVLIPIHEAIPNILELTLKSVSESDYPREKIEIILGDDTNENYDKLPELKELASRYDSNYIYDTSNLNFKAGMLNIMLKEINSEFIVFLDYDHKMSKTFLKQSIRALTEDENIAFAQSKVNFYNIQSKLQIWESVMYAQFFEIFQRSKNQRKTVLFNGSTACFRKKILDEVGGVPVNTFTEDIDLSIQILSKGYSSCLIDDYGSLGLIPANLSLLLSQILRWAKGSMHTLKKRWKKILFSKLAFYDKMDLFFSTSLFFIASSMYLTILFYVIMFFTGSKAVRLPIQDFLPLAIMPISFVFAYQISGLIAIIFARKNGLTHMKLYDLILFSIIALALNPFTVYAVLKTIFRIRPPEKGRDTWNEKVPLIPLSLLFTLLGAGILVIAFFDFFGGTKTLWLVLLLLGSSLIATFPVSLYYHLTTRHNKPYFYQHLSQDIE
ncbi:MAG: glycosyltransferase family 2 protein [Candidatus Heimdallarchaeaceae archaeon]|jgi:cellulose synthase/poly-beta-1,6-N-acetylglucosamine synthase-like glycosyltransferase